MHRVRFVVFFLGTTKDNTHVGWRQVIGLFERFRVLFTFDQSFDGWVFGFGLFGGSGVGVAVVVGGGGGGGGGVFVSVAAAVVVVALDVSLVVSSLVSVAAAVVVVCFVVPFVVSVIVSVIVAVVVGVTVLGGVCSVISFVVSGGVSGGGSGVGSGGIGCIATIFCVLAPLALHVLVLVFVGCLDHGSWFLFRGIHFCSCRMWRCIFWNFDLAIRVVVTLGWVKGRCRDAQCAHYRDFKSSK